MFLILKKIHLLLGTLVLLAIRIIQVPENFVNQIMEMMGSILIGEV